jgi:hypothetical protein
MKLLRRTNLFAMLALLVPLLLQTSVAAQCAMCRASLEGSNNSYFIRNFNIGVLVLLVPPVAMFCSIFVVLRRHKAAPTEPDKPEEPESEV